MKRLAVIDIGTNSIHMVRAHGAEETGGCVTEAREAREAPDTSAS